MTIRFLNCFTCNARYPRSWRSGTLCLLLESNMGLVLVDTGLGQSDYINPPGILRVFQAVTIVPLDPEEAAIRQVIRLGYAPNDVRHIILTHLHFDHAGGLPDFPHANVHIYHREYEAFMGKPHSWLELAYTQRCVSHGPNWIIYHDTGENWFDFEAIQLSGFDPQIWLVPLPGHTRGHCGVAIQTPEGWLFHVGDSAPMEFTKEVPDFLVRMVLGTHGPRLAAFSQAHPEIRMTTGHLWLSSFESQEQSKS